FSSRRRHTRSKRDWSSDVCSSDLCCPAGIKPHHLSCQDKLLSIITASFLKIIRRDSRQNNIILNIPEFPIMGQPGIKAGWIIIEIGRASCRGKSEDVGGQWMLKEK